MIGHLVLPAPITLPGAPVYFRNDYCDPRNRRGTKVRHRSLDIFQRTGSLLLTPAEAVWQRGGQDKLGGFHAVFTVHGAAYIWDFYVCHLLGPAVLSSLHPGTVVPRGTVFACVGSSGNASKAAPHAHIQIEERRRGEPRGNATRIDPYFAFCSVYVTSGGPKLWGHPARIPSPAPDDVLRARLETEVAHTRPPCYAVVAVNESVDKVEVIA